MEKKLLTIYDIFTASDKGTVVVGRSSEKEVVLEKGTTIALISPSGESREVMVLEVQRKLMAYLTFIASLPASEIARFREGSLELMSASKIERVSHYLAYSVNPQPLGKLLGQAIDGGQLLREDLWHPLRAPIVKTEDEVKNLWADLIEAWTIVTREAKVSEDDWYKIEITKLLAVYDHARQNSECIVSMLAPPADSERARKVKILF